MGSQNIIKLIAALVTVVAVLSVTTAAEVAPAPAPLMDCGDGLSTCLPFLNTTTKPSAACCDAIKDVVEDEACLCHILSPAELAANEITEEQALSLPARCSIPVDASTCEAGPPSSPPAPSPGN